MSCSPRPAAGSTPTTRNRFSVSVPVLSRQRVSTDARLSTAFSRCASVPSRASRTAATAKVRLVSSTRPSGTSGTSAATTVCADSGERHVPDPQRHDQRGRERDHGGNGPPEDPVDVGLEGAEGGAGTAGLGREALGEALGPHRLDDVLAGAGDAVGAREQGLARLPLHRLALPGQDRLVDGEAARHQHGSVGDHLVARLQPHDVPGDDAFDGQLRDRAVAAHARLRGDQEREPVENALGADLLDDPDERVGHDHATEERIARVAQREGQRE